MVNYHELAIEVLRDWLLNQWEEADLAQVLIEDPDGVQLLDDDFEKVLASMTKLKVDFNIQ